MCAVCAHVTTIAATKRNDCGVFEFEETKKKFPYNGACVIQYLNELFFSGIQWIQQSFRHRAESQRIQQNANKIFDYFPQTIHTLKPTHTHRHDKDFFPGLVKILEKKCPQQSSARKKNTFHLHKQWIFIIFE